MKTLKLIGYTSALSALCLAVLLVTYSGTEIENDWFTKTMTVLAICYSVYMTWCTAKE